MRNFMRKMTTAASSASQATAFSNLLFRYAEKASGQFAFHPDDVVSRDSLECAHFQPCLLPDKNGKLLIIASPKPSSNNADVAKHFATVCKKNQVKHILIVGTPTSDFDYTQATENNIAITKMPVVNDLLNLNNDELETLLNIYTIYQNHTVLVHCHFGIDASGQVRMLFALLDAYEKNIAFRLACNTLFLSISLNVLDTQQQKLSEEALHIIFSHIVETLNALRKIRYCLQTKKQMTTLLPQLLLLLAKKMQYPDEKLNEIRVRVAMTLPNSKTICTDLYEDPPSLISDSELIDIFSSPETSPRKNPAPPTSKQTPKQTSQRWHLPLFPTSSPTLKERHSPLFSTSSSTLKGQHSLLLFKPSPPTSKRENVRTPIKMLIVHDNEALSSLSDSEILAEITRGDTPAVDAAAPHQPKQITKIIARTAPKQPHTQDMETMQDSNSSSHTLSTTSTPNGI